MWHRVKTGLKWTLIAALVLLAVVVVTNWTLVQRLFLGGLRVYETTTPELPASIQRPAVLVFSKTNSFRHEGAIVAANALFDRLAREQRLGHFQTESGAAFTSRVLERFDVVVFNNVTGDVLTADQKQAFERWIRNGGSFIGLHGAGDRSHHRWSWYTTRLIRARFIEKTVFPSVQPATVRLDDPSHPLAQGLPRSWTHAEEWYSFDQSPRQRGSRVLLTVDENTYDPRGLLREDIRMGADHPIAWMHCEGRGRVFYTAIGHRAEAFSEPQVIRLLANALGWSTDAQNTDCGATR